MSGIGILLSIINGAMLFICFMCLLMSNMSYSLKELNDIEYKNKMKTYVISSIFSIISLICIISMTTDPFSLGMSMLFTFMSMYVHYMYFDLQ